jgi:hypothetical protein
MSKKGIGRSPAGSAAAQRRQATLPRAIRVTRFARCLLRRDVPVLPSTTEFYSAPYNPFCLSVFLGYPVTLEPFSRRLPTFDLLSRWGSALRFYTTWTSAPSRRRAQSPPVAGGWSDQTRRTRAPPVTCRGAARREASVHSQNYRRATRAGSLRSAAPCPAAGCQRDVRGAGYRARRGVARRQVCKATLGPLNRNGSSGGNALSRNGSSGGNAQDLLARARAHVRDRAGAARRAARELDREDERRSRRAERGQRHDLAPPPQNQMRKRKRAAGSGPPQDCAACSSAAARPQCDLFIHKGVRVFVDPSHSGSAPSA